MEEDINILDEVVGRSKELREKDFGMLIGTKQMQSIENLLKGYRELEEELKREKIWRIRLEKENEDTCNEVNNNYIRKSLVIPKSKIQEKIDELEKLKKELEKDNNKFWHPGINNIIYHIKELMEDK